VVPPGKLNLLARALLFGQPRNQTHEWILKNKLHVTKILDPKLGVQKILCLFVILKRKFLNWNCCSTFLNMY